EFGSGSCYISDDSEPRTATQVVPASPDLSLKFEILDGITGNIIVKESDSYADHAIRIKSTIRASSTSLLDQIQTSYDSSSVRSAHSWIHIKDSNDKEAKKRLLRGNCARSDVEIIYPRSFPGTGKLQLSATNGKFNINMNNHTDSWGPVLTSFEELQMGLTNGEVNVDGVVVSKKLLMEVANGHIMGNVKSAGKVVAQIINGPVDLEIDSTPRRDDWDANNLHVAINTVNGRIGLYLVKRFLGHFSFSATIGTPTIRLASSSKDIIKFTARSGHEVKGWISVDQNEPDALSKLDLTTVNGNILVEVETLKK
ncbi:hypothetical protein BGX27_003846, partial [Mortierella sp. AM989]